MDTGRRLEVSLLALRTRALKILLARKGISVSEDLLQKQLELRSNAEIIQQYQVLPRHRLERFYATLRRLRSLSHR